VIDKAKLASKVDMVENEIAIMKQCNHVNIVRLYEEYETRTDIYLIMELVKVPISRLRRHLYRLRGCIKYGHPYTVVPVILLGLRRR